MKLYTYEVKSCIGVIGRGQGGCPAGYWADVNHTTFHCTKTKKDVDFNNRPEKVRYDEYIPKWCPLEDVKNGV